MLPFAGDGDTRPVWRLSVPPQAGAALAGSLAADTDADAFLDWGGGLIWLAIPRSDAASADAIRAAVAESGGHATLIRAPEELRAAVPVFEPQTGGLAALSARIKESFDPLGILNPGRMYAGV